ncbi:YceI family protein [Fulvivirga sediminis]|uniref:YceI family protein n=1 Tax=Fulvivirga sediminis TaxID=2803949 RepID=A0A937F4U9_9BACT|nr:YceI family protein [Fulvivirga sediminis]MBL3655790.1 YceI family protein [Fulvivirga sediminis]
MKIMSFAIGLALAPFFAKAQTIQRVTIQPESHFSLSGTSNINSFRCVMENAFSNNQLNVCYNQEEDQLIFEKTGFHLAVEKFDCGNAKMTHDLKNALKAETYPKIEFELLTLAGLKAGDCEPVAESVISIAGQANKYLLKYIVKQISEDQYRIYLNADFNMTDFGIAPPTAMMGIVKVNEMISINLILNVVMK